MEASKESQVVNNPIISIILPVYNGELYIRSAIESILSQSLGNYELIIIDDGSTDNSIKFIRSYSDDRIKIISHKKNFGLIATLNHGLAIAKGDYIGRMDQDDLSDPKRLEKQLKFLQSSNEIAVVGSLYASVNEHGEFISVAAQPISNEDIRFGLTTQNCFGHGSILIDKSKIPKQLFHYPEKFEHAEDYALWVTLSTNNIKMANLAEVLYSWRYHAESISSKASIEQQASVDQILIMQDSHRLSFGMKDIWSLFLSAFTNAPAKVLFKNEEVDSNLKRTYQYILIDYAAKVARNKPLHSAFAIILSIVISPMNLIKKILYG